MIVFGIDPGFGGAIAELHVPSGTVHIYDMPTVPGQKGKQELAMRPLFDLLDSHVAATVWLEKVGARPGQGVSSMFRFGQQLGALEMAVAAHSHQLRYVTPASWKKHFGLVADKGAARSIAMQRFPAQAQIFARVKDDGRAEAALIALYGAEQGGVR
jgi:crossover junction endodeoxyribonuclease RuvC